MKEFSLQSLENETVSEWKEVFGNDSDKSDSEQSSTPEPTTDTPRVTKTPTTDTPTVTTTPTRTPVATTKALKSTTTTTKETSSSDESEYFNTDSESSDRSESLDDSVDSEDDKDQVDDSDSWYQSDSADNEYDSGIQQTTTMTPTTIPSVTTSTPSLSDASTTGASAYDSPTQSITTSSSSNTIPGGAIAGVVVGSACVLFVLAAFVTMKKRALNKQNSKGKDSLGSSRAMPLNSSGLFGRLNSGRNKKDPEMDEIFTIDNKADPFVTNNLASKKSEPKGIWDDPVLVAARIPMHDVQMKELISRGGFGLVYMGTYHGETVAVKTLLPETRKDMNEITALFAEIKVVATLEHPCIVRFIGIAWDSLSTVSCVTEYLVGGDLRAMLNHFQSTSQRPQGFDYDKVRIALDVVNGLTYLHSLETAILHRDLKSRNVLLSSNLDAKLTDFGVSRERTDELMTTAVGTSLWMAPEVMMGGHYDGKADVFSFGVLLSEIDTHMMPYANVKNPSGRKPTEAAILQMVAIGTLQVEFSSECTPEIRKLANACISLDPQERPTAADALYQLQLALKSFEVQEVTL